jgi:hypothetical protein
MAVESEKKQKMNLSLALKLDETEKKLKQATEAAQASGARVKEVVKQKKAVTTEIPYPVLGAVKGNFDYHTIQAQPVQYWTPNRVFTFDAATGNNIGKTESCQFVCLCS